jgi:hypothetical protein
MTTSRKTLYLTAAVVVSLLVTTPQVRGDPTLDLTGTGVVSGYINGGFFTRADPQGTGSGNIQSFVRIQANGTEQGYNVNLPDITPEFDEKGGGFTHPLLISDVPIVRIDGVDYREFLLDVDEGGTEKSRYISLDSMQIYLADSPDRTGYPDLGVKIFDLDSLPTTDNWILLDATLRSGSGSGDMFAYIPNSLFNVQAVQYVYLYSKFGGSDPEYPRAHDSDGGPEEWSTRTDVTPPPPPIPAPGAVLLALFGSSIAVSLHRRHTI